MKVVIDTPVLISGILWKGTPNNILMQIEDSDSHLIVQSQETFAELVKMLKSEKFSQIIKKRNLDLQLILESLDNVSEFFKISEKNFDSITKEISMVDVNDLVFIALAMEANADYIVSGNNTLLSLINYKNINIITPDYFMEMLYREKRKHRRYNFKEDVLGFFQLQDDVSGSFKNFEKFLVHNISLGGFNLLSNYSPDIGSTYPISVEKEKGKIQFDIQVVYTRIHKMTNQKEKIFNPGTIYSIGCKIGFLDEEQKEYIIFLIRNKCAYVEPKFISTPPKS